MYIESGLEIGPGMEISLPPYPTSIEYLLVAGGGGGGTSAGGGGGGFVTGNYNIPAGATIAATIGAGGAEANVAYSQGYSGSNSSFVNDIDLAKSGSIYLNGTSQYLTTPYNSVFDFGSGDFTIEGWYNFTTLNGNSSGIDTLVILGNGAAPSPAISCAWGIIYTAGALKLSRYDSGIPTDYTLTFTPSTPLRTGAWYHVACTKSGSDVRMFLNGYQVGTTQSTANTYGPLNGNPLYVGSFQNQGYLSNFNVSNLRIVKGTAVYTSNFTPSSNALTATQAANVNGSPSAAITGTQTSLLLNTVYGANYLNDSSSYNLPITNVNSATSQTTEPIYTVNAYGGGGGGGYYTYMTGRYGGSGGGAGHNYTGAGGAAGPGFQGQGYAGGGVASNAAGGGGGGAGGVGASSVSTSTGGAGGVGAISAITGTSYYWAGGGGGCGGGGGNGGAGGGQGGQTGGTMGTGYNNASLSGAGENTGGGGGGLNPYGGDIRNATGGSGIAVFRYPAIFNAATATTGSPIYSTVGGYRVYIFTGSGSITF